MDLGGRHHTSDLDDDHGFTSQEDDEESKGLLSERQIGYGGTAGGPRENTINEDHHYLNAENSRFKLERTPTNANNQHEEEAQLTMDEYIQSVGDVGWFQYFAFMSLFLLV
jgi:hypothetical protein